MLSIRDDKCCATNNRPFWIICNKKDMLALFGFLVILDAW